MGSHTLILLLFGLRIFSSVAHLESTERLLICADLNGHVGFLVEGFEIVHGGSVERNIEGERILECADAFDLAIEGFRA